MTSPTTCCAPELLCRWDRLGVGIRCAYAPDDPNLIRRYLALGCRLVRLGVMSQWQVSHRTLEVLLQTANDDGLPWYWRSVCLEHTSMPVSRLTSLLKLHDPLGTQVVQASVEQAQEALGATPSARVVSFCEKWGRGSQ